MSDDRAAAEARYEDEVIGDDTIPNLFEASARRNANRPAQRYKGGVYERSLVASGVVEAAPAGDYATLTYREMRDVVRHLAAGFRDLGVETGDRVGILANTRMEWAQSDFALLAAGGVVTTVYVESTPEQVRYLLSDPGASGVVVENADLLEVEDDLDLSFVVVLDEVEGYDDREDVHTLGEVHERGREAFDEEAYRSWLDARDLDDLASLIYTSGTTGEPKGVQLTHGNFRANVNQVRRRFGPRPDRPPEVPTIDSDSTTLSFLPLAHVFERTAGHFVPFASGTCVAYAESTDTVADDIALVKPTGATSVPRIYERIFRGMREQASESDAKARIFEWAVGVARQRAQTDDPGLALRAQHALADRLVYSTVRENLGGEIELFISGGGSLSKDLARLFIGMGLTVCEGYGLTETAPVVSCNPPEDIRAGTLGPALTDIEVRIDGEAVPEEQRAQTVAGGEVGELLVRGPNVTDGYWNRPEETEAAFTEDGFFRTGDIVERTDDDYLVFLDRLKQLIVLSTGKNVAPGPIEDRFATVERVEQVMLLGDDRKFVGALVVPNVEAVRSWAEREGVDLPADREALCDDERVRAYVGEAIERVNEGLGKAERIKQFELVPEEWTPENDLLTPSLKLKRRNIRARYADRVEAVYDRPKQETAADD
ncbi:AMP-dependent synthetase/ligase [Halomarina ordinaria]|uniref:AMP-dependent synthetase/ligase n=1 Tax=Halomarina ordinaria TaxID=3033939 RepID=A0ABD5UCK4_9EURY|nr:long-chain fatty acid--CoA ligase [Halomarina sp. PSRA2]